MSTKTLTLFIAMTLWVATGALSLSAQTITTFDAPGAGTDSGQGTFATSINPAGTIVGIFHDGNNLRHGFRRDKHGNFTIFDPPGAGTCVLDCVVARGLGRGTRVWGINPAGAVTGWYITDSGVAHAYVRAPDGTFTSFDAPDAGTGIYPQGTFPGFGGWGNFINPAGTITGKYTDSNHIQHGFVRAPDGTITEFDLPNSIDTEVSAINSAGAITGSYTDSNFLGHGFVRAPDGTFTSFDIPGVDEFGDTIPTGITPSGAVYGFYVANETTIGADPKYVEHGFLGAPGGPFTKFDPPDMNSIGSFDGTIPTNNSPHGTIIGNFINATKGTQPGFVRAPDGTITEFDFPNSCCTYPNSINPAGAITGYYADQNFVAHGFVATQ